MSKKIRQCKAPAAIYALELIESTYLERVVDGVSYYGYDNTVVKTKMHERFGNTESVGSLNACKARANMTFSDTMDIDGLFALETEDNDNDIDLQFTNEATREQNRLNAIQAGLDGLVRDVKGKRVWDGKFKDSSEEVLMTTKGYKVSLHNYVTVEERDRKLALITIEKGATTLNLNSVKTGSDFTIDSFEDVFTPWTQGEDDIIRDMITNKIANFRALDRIATFNREDGNDTIRTMICIVNRSIELQNMPIEPKVVYKSKEFSTKESVAKFNQRMVNVKLKNNTMIVLLKQMVKPMVELARSASYKLVWSLEKID